MKKIRCRKLLAIMFSALFMLSLSTAYAAPVQSGSDNAVSITRATHSIVYYATKASNGTGLLSYGRVMSNVSEGFISISLTLQQYKDGKWSNYAPYSGNVTNNTLCIVSEISNPPKNYYYRVAFSYASSTFNPNEIWYSDAYLWN